MTDARPGDGRLTVSMAAWRVVDHAFLITACLVACSFAVFLLVPVDAFHGLIHGVSLLMGMSGGAVTWGLMRRMTSITDDRHVRMLPVGATDKEVRRQLAVLHHHRSQIRDMVRLRQQEASFRSTFDLMDQLRLVERLIDAIECHHRHLPHGRGQGDRDWSEYNTLLLQEREMAEH